MNRQRENGVISIYRFKTGRVMFNPLLQQDIQEHRVLTQI